MEGYGLARYGISRYSGSTRYITQSDVDYATAFIEKIRQKGWAGLTSEEQQEWLNGLKAFLNNFDLNRIELKCKNIAQRLNKYGYYVFIYVKTDWLASLIKQYEIDRIRNNVKIIVTASNKMPGTPDIVFGNILDWHGVNALEINLDQTDVFIDYIIQSFRYSGTFVCGQDFEL